MGEWDDCSWLRIGSFLPSLSTRKLWFLLSCHLLVLLVFTSDTSLQDDRYLSISACIFKYMSNIGVARSYITKWVLHNHRTATSLERMVNVNYPQMAKHFGLVNDSCYSVTQWTCNEAKNTYTILSHTYIKCYPDFI